MFLKPRGEDVGSRSVGARVGASLLAIVSALAAVFSIVAGVNFALRLTHAITPSHYYFLEHHGEYGYRRKLTKADATAGKSSEPIVMVRYVGFKRDRYTVESVSGMTIIKASCRGRCAYFTVRQFYGGLLIGKRIYPSNKSVIAYALKDAANGKLETYQSWQKEERMVQEAQRHYANRVNE